MNKNQKRNLMIGLGVAVVGIGAGTYFVLQSPEDETKSPEKELINEEISTKLFGYTDNGVVTLYDTEKNVQLDSFDLKTLATGKEIVVQEPVKVEEKEKPVVTSEFEGFIRVPHIVVKGENSWKIQEALTPTRNTTKMLQLVQKANGTRNLSLIYPGETIYYLKESDGSSPEDVVNEVQTGEALPEETKVVQTVDENAVYLYSKSEDFTTLYAYNDIEKAFYSVSIEDNKIKTSIIYTNDALEGVTQFKVFDNQLYVVYENGKKVKEVSLSDVTKDKEYALEDIASVFHVEDGFIYYTYADQLGKINLKDGEKSNILLGDETIDYVFTEDKFYFLNKFGTELDNSVLIKVDPTEFKVDNLVELKSKDNVILSEETDSNLVYVGQIRKTTDLNKQVIEEDVILPITTETLNKELFVKKVPFNKDAFEVNEFVYEVKEGTAIIYSAKTGDISAEVNVEKSTHVMPLN